MNTEYTKHYIVLEDGETYCELSPYCLLLSVTEEGQKSIEEHGDSVKHLIQGDLNVLDPNLPLIAEKSSLHRAKSLEVSCE